MGHQSAHGTTKIASPEMSTRRLLRVAIVMTTCLVAAGLLALAESSVGAPSSQSNGLVVQKGAVLPATGRDHSATATTAPPVPATLQVGGNCGTHLLAGGWPTTTTLAQQTTTCIEAALRIGRSATFTEVAQTDGQGGHPRVTTFRVTARNRLLVTINTMKAKPRGTVQKWRCTGLATSGDELVATGCKKA
jgi:hypothetical protein